MNKFAIIAGTLCTATAALNAQVFDHSADFETALVGSDPSDSSGSVWITASWWPEGSTNCGDGTVVSSGNNAAIIDVGPSFSCNDRPGAVVGSGSMLVGNGVMVLNFRPGKYPDSVSFGLFQFAVTNPGTVTVYGVDDMVIDSQAFSGSSHSFSTTPGQDISRIEIANAHGFTLDNLEWSGVETDGAYMKTIDFEGDTPGSVSGSYGLVHFQVLEGYECGTGNAGDGTSPLSGDQCLVLDGGNPNNDPDDGCSNSVHGVAIAGSNDPNYAGTLGAFFHPSARPNFVTFDIRQHAVLGPVNIVAYDSNDNVVYSDTVSSSLDSISINSAVGLDRVEIEGLYPFTLDDFTMTGVGGDVPCPADMNGDGTLDFFDVSEFLSQFGAGCP